MPVERPGGVAWLAYEGENDLQTRTAAWMQARGVTSEPKVHFYTNPGSILDDAYIDWLIADLRAKFVDDLKAVIVDTWADAISSGGGDENGAKDTGKAINNLKRIRAATGAVIAPIHHTGHDGDRERGSTALRAAADVMFLIKEQALGVRQITFRKGRRVDTRRKLHFRLRPVAPSFVPEPTDEGVIEIEPTVVDPRLARCRALRAEHPDWKMTRLAQTIGGRWETASEIAKQVLAEEPPVQLPEL
jgi:hypothetical protein